MGKVIFDINGMELSVNDVVIHNIEGKYYCGRIIKFTCDSVWLNCPVIDHRPRRSSMKRIVKYPDTPESNLTLLTYGIKGLNLGSIYGDCEPGLDFVGNKLNIGDTVMCSFGMRIETVRMTRHNYVWLGDESYGTFASHILKVIV